MTKKKIIFSILLIIIAVVFTSCGAGTTDRLTAEEIEDYENYIISSYFMLRGDQELPQSRAAWDYNTEVNFPTVTEYTTKTKNNYPESGQYTTVKLEKTSNADVYKVTNATYYPGSNGIHKTIESYYVKDRSADPNVPDGIFKQAEDIICKFDGTPDPKSRIEYRTVYSDKSERIGIIQKVFPNVKYAEFDINGTLEYPDSNDQSTWGGGSFNDEGVWIPGPSIDGDNTQWSSMTSYDHITTKKIKRKIYTKHLFGARYYTEQGSLAGGDLVRTSVSYERTIVTTSQSGSQNGGHQLLYYDKDSDELSGIYAQTVIRTRIENNGSKIVKMDSVLFDNKGSKKINIKAEFEKDADGSIIKEGKPKVYYR